MQNIGLDVYDSSRTQTSRQLANVLSALITTMIV